MAADGALQAGAAAEAAARRSYGKLVAFLAARTRDVAGAEDALADAFAQALQRWPESGVPRNPEAWLLAVARRRSVDAVRRRVTRDAARDHLALLAEETEMSEQAYIPDERLRLMFACAHPAIERGVRAPLILQTILGFDAATIASAFLVPPATMGQRLVRAKTRIREAGIPFRVPERSELPERLDAVLEAIYAAFAEGWTDANGTDSQRRNLATEGLWLGRLMAMLMPDEPEVLGLLALMLFAEARRLARRSEAGEYVPLAEQDISKWDADMIDEAEDLLRRASRMEGLGRYQLEAAIQSAHTARRTSGRTDWPAIRQLYDALTIVAPSPVVAINRAVATAELEAVAEALRDLDALAGEKRLADYQPYWAARAQFLARMDRLDEARQAYDRAIGLEREPAVRRFLQERRNALKLH